MVKGLYTAYSGLMNEQNRMDVMTNNLANATTVGFKKEGSTSQTFDSVLALKIKDTSLGSPNVQRLALNTPGVKIGENYTDYSNGSFRITDNTFDLALDGEGFFALEVTNSAGETSTKYTRAGNFTLNNEGYLVNNEGHYVLDVDSRRIQLNPLQTATIDSTGTITQNDATVAQIQVADFENYDYLEHYADVYFQPVEGAELITSSATVNSGYLEMANVQVVSEMVNMISITRQYESNQKVVQTIDETLQIAVNDIGRL